MNHFLWGKSVWWTRTGWILALALIVCGAFMSYLLDGHLGSCGLPQGLSNPGLAIELAYDWPAVLSITGPCQSQYCRQSVSQQVCLPGTACQYICPDKVEALLQQQSWDRVFIVLYACLFVYLGLINFRFAELRVDPADAGAPWYVRWWTAFLRIIPSRWIGRIGGLAAALFALVGAWYDWLEDDKIVDALQHIGQAGAGYILPAMRDDAYHKWLFLFLAIGCASPIFAFWPGRANDDGGARPSHLMQFLGLLTAFEAITTMLSGFLACRYGQDQRVEDATGGLFLTLPLAAILLLTAQYWRHGTLNALQSLAKTWLFMGLVNFQKEEDT